jgi:hypothetical protein
VGPTVKISSLLPLSLLSPPLFTSLLLFQTVKTPPSSLFHLSQNPWRFEDSTKERPQDRKQKDLPRLLFTSPFEFFGFNSSSSPKVFKSSFCPISLHGAKI